MRRFEQLRKEDRPFRVEMALMRRAERLDLDLG